MEFRFETTAQRFADDSVWASWIYQTDAKRKVNIGLMIILTALFAGATIYVEVAWGNGAGDALLAMGSMTIIWALFAAVVSWRNWNWMDWKKQFLEVQQMPFGGEDGPMTVVLTENGCTLFLGDERIERFQWKKIEAVRTWSKGWDIIDKPGFSGISLREEDMTAGDSASFTRFLQAKCKNTIKPRAIEIEALKRRYGLD